MFGARERYLRKFQTQCFMDSFLTLEHATSFVMMSFVGIFGVLLMFCYLSSLLQSVDDVEIPSADLQCELSTTEFQVWSKVIRSCDISLEVGADSSQPAIEFSRNRAIERPWDVWIRKFIHFFYQRNNYLQLRVCQLMELQPFGDALSVTISYLLAIESMYDLTRAIIEQEGVTYGLHFAQIQLRSSFFCQQDQQVLQ
mmetsp:Transcript_15849/g.35543  ORF Transcript_15849/g.35543 Transcript_15849/m.35543 type:complete len:198 (-) Transcript_15849:509-1102(-)